MIDSPETTSFRSTMQWIKEKFPLTFDTCPGLKMVSLTNPIYLKYWNIFEVLLEKESVEVRDRYMYRSLVVVFL
jgi:hypothetical protein